MKKIITLQARFPEELHGEVPFLLGEHNGTFVVVFDADVDGFQPFPRKNAEEIVQDYVEVPISTFLKIAKWQDAINHI